MAKPSLKKSHWHQPSPTSNNNNNSTSKVTFNLDGIEEAVAELNNADLLERKAEEEIKITQKMLKKASVLEGRILQRITKF